MDPTLEKEEDDLLMEKLWSYLIEWAGELNICFDSL
jgi:hypothetical protein